MLIWQTKDVSIFFKLQHYSNDPTNPKRGASLSTPHIRHRDSFGGDCGGAVFYFFADSRSNDFETLEIVCILR